MWSLPFFAWRSVADLLKLVKKYGLSAASCVEKADLVAQLRDAHAVHQARTLSDRRARDTEAARDRIVAEVGAWAKARSLPQLLNELNAATMPSDDLHVPNKVVSFTPVSKVRGGRRSGLRSGLL
jgi:hypothetical protein